MGVGNVEKGYDDGVSLERGKGPVACSTWPVAGEKQSPLDRIGILTP